MEGKPPAPAAGGVYSNIEIRQAIDSGHIICHPFTPVHVAHASLDITLGYYYYRTETRDSKIVYNPFDRDDTERYFDGPFKALEHAQWAKLNGVQPIDNIPLDHPVIALKPGERILAHTHEFFGIKPPGAITIHSRSSWGRNGVAVCFDAGWVDPGYINRLTLQIYNLNQHETILLPVGERIAQAVFHHTGAVEGNYGLGRDNNLSGKYQMGVALQDLVRTWSPDQMIPRSYLDKRTLPPTIEGAMYA